MLGVASHAVDGRGEPELLALDLVLAAVEEVVLLYAQWEAV